MSEYSVTQSVTNNDRDFLLLDLENKIKSLEQQLAEEKKVSEKLAKHFKSCILPTRNSWS